MEKSKMLLDQSILIINVLKINVVYTIIYNMFNSIISKLDLIDCNLCLRYYCCRSSIARVLRIWSNHGYILLLIVPVVR